MQTGTGYFTIFELLIAVYLIWCAISGKGKLFENENLKIPRERYVKVLRVMGGITGGVLLLSNGLVMAGAVQEGSAVSWIAWVIGFGCILAMAVFSAKSSRKPMEAPRQQSGEDPLRSAFVFDEEEQTKK